MPTSSMPRPGTAHRRSPALCGSLAAAHGVFDARVGRRITAQRFRRFLDPGEQALWAHALARGDGWLLCRPWPSADSVGWLRTAWWRWRLCTLCTPAIARMRNDALLDYSRRLKFSVLLTSAGCDTNHITLAPAVFSTFDRNHRIFNCRSNYICLYTIDQITDACRTISIDVTWATQHLWTVHCNRPGHNRVLPRRSCLDR